MENDIIDIPIQEPPKQKNEAPKFEDDKITKKQAAEEVLFCFKKLNFCSLILCISPLLSAAIYKFSIVIGSVVILISMAIGGFLFYRSKKEIERLTLKYNLVPVKRGLF